MKKKVDLFFIISIACCFTVVLSCSKKTEKAEDTTAVETPTSSLCNLAAISSTSSVNGFGIMDKLSGIWNGPVYSPTALGSFPEWVVDFRPISPSQVSAKNELDSLNDIFMSFFVVKHNCEYKMAFRNGGGFAGSVRNAYMVIDSLNETSAQSFYRFVDPVSGGNRVYADITFKLDSLTMHVYTNKYNSLSTPVTHMRWTANLRDTTAAQDAITLFNFPQKVVTKDFTTTFDGLTDAVFYNAAADPYPEQDQPYLGNSTININVTNPSTVNTTKKILILITTEPLFNGLNFIPANLDFRSRYVYVAANSFVSFNFNYMHPGNYYVNAIYDNNGDLNFSSGDYMNTPLDVPLSLINQGSSNANVTINFQIP